MKEARKYSLWVHRLFLLCSQPASYQNPIVERARWVCGLLAFLHFWLGRVQVLGEPGEILVIIFVSGLRAAQAVPLGPSISSRHHQDWSLCSSSGGGGQCVEL